MATIKQYGGTGLASNWASIILESDTEATTLPISTIDATKAPLQNHNRFSVGSEAFCPSSGNAFILTGAGWIKL
ncbi:MAG: hypothetical protein UHD64_02945 [Bacteroidales bacterium]|nr:hypothetical protein [Bacteroidales bacterium]